MKKSNNPQIIKRNFTSVNIVPESKSRFLITLANRQLFFNIKLTKTYTEPNMVRSIQRVFQQIGCLIFMLLAPVLWYKSLFLMSLETLQDVDAGYFVFTLGILLIVEAFLYLQLPLDLIPDCIPLIGKCDDFMALSIGVLGGILSMVGFYSWVN